MESDVQSPRAHFPNTEADKSDLHKDLKKSGNPKCEKTPTESINPIQLELCSNKKSPKWRKSRIGKDEAAIAFPGTETTRPIRACCLKSIDEAMLPKFQTEMTKSTHPSERTGSIDSTTIISTMNDAESG